MICLTIIDTRLGIQKKIYITEINGSSLTLKNDYNNLEVYCGSSFKNPVTFLKYKLFYQMVNLFEEYLIIQTRRVIKSLIGYQEIPIGRS